MILNSIKLKDFRCFEFLDISFSKGINNIHGANGVGKSTIVEAINLSLTTKSFRSNMVDTLIKKGSQRFETLLSIEKFIEIKGVKEKNNTIKFIDKNTDKIIKPKDIITNFPSVFVENLDFDFLDSSPLSKRRYLNKLLFYVEHNSFLALEKFNLALKQRNMALKKGDYEASEPWTMQIIELEPAISQANLDIISIINKKLCSSRLIKLFSSKNKWIEDLNLEYFTGFDSSDSLKNVLRKEKDLDLILKRTRSGPHKRSFKINIDDNESKDRLSRGQQKLLSILLALFQCEMIQEKGFTKPVLLIDDFSSELDKENLDLMLEYLLENSMQVITTTIDPIKSNKDINLFHVEQNFKQ